MTQNLQKKMHFQKPGKNFQKTFGHPGNIVNDAAIQHK